MDVFIVVSLSPKIVLFLFAVYGQGKWVVASFLGLCYTHNISKAMEKVMDI